ncbi:helix-turn-helix domain-containing protein [Glycomyces salinus]|uniref:helix-turn-helix domain-containing protein n=1 Tax=Glycomyces salinus TaxID=980294 RepID=UPI003556A268
MTGLPVTGDHKRSHGPREGPVVDLSVSYYNSEPQVKGILARLRRLLTAIDARDWHEPVPQLSQLARDCRNGRPRAIRDRLTPEEYEHLLEAVRAGVPKRQLATQFGISLRSVYRLLADRR